MPMTMPAIPSVASCCAVLCCSLVAQEPPILTTNPPVQSSQFGATALGSGTTEVAALQFTYDPTATSPTWFLSATIKNPSSAFYQPYSGRVTGTPGAYTVTPNSDYSLVPAPTTDYFAANVSPDLKIMVIDTGAATPPSVYVRSSTTGPFVPFGSIGAPVVPTYVDSQIGNTLTSWNGTTGVYEFIYVSGLNLMMVPMTLTAPSTVTLGTPVQIAPTGIQKHSPSPMRQWTGPASDWGTARALLFSQNDSSADAYYRSSLADITTTPINPALIYDDAGWKANPGHIGGATYWAYAMPGYVNPLQLDICAVGSATVSPGGGSVTICAWSPPMTTPVVGFVMLGVLQSPGLPLNPPFSFIAGKLGITPTSLILLPTVSFDPTNGEMCYSFGTGPMPPGCIDLQVGCYDLGGNKLAMGNTTVIKVQ